MDRHRGVISSIAPPAQLRHDYDEIAKYRARSERVLEQMRRVRERVRDVSSLREVANTRLRRVAGELIGSPYYLERLRDTGLSPRDLRSVAELPFFPTLDRQTYGECWGELPVMDTDSRARRDAAVVSSSGSTGTPISVLRDGYDLLHMWTVLRYWAQTVGVELPPEPTVVLLCTLPGGLEYSSRLPTLNDGMLYRISTRHPEPVERLLRADPDVIFSDPAGFHWLAGRDRLPEPRLLLTSAQYFSPDQRRRLNNRVPAPVVNYYSSSETGPIAWECVQEPGRFHILSSDVWVEEVEGELVVTRLRETLVPLLRYRMGDTGCVGFDECTCGYVGRTITGFTGRRGCTFETPDGERVDAWQLAWLFKHFPLDDFRLTQVEAGVFRLELVRQDGADDFRELHGKLERSLQALGWTGPEVDVEFVEAIESSGGKPEPFVGFSGGD